MGKSTKIIGTLIGNARGLLGHLDGKFMERIGLKAPGNYSASVWSYRNSTFYDFGISGRVPEPQNQLFVSSETPGYLK